MNQYEKEMFDFLTKEENMKGLIIAKNQFGFIRSQLLSEFWNLTHQKTVDLFKKESNFNVILQDDIQQRFSKLYVFEKNLPRQSNDFPSLMFCWERLTTSFPYYGFWINEKSIEYDIKKIHAYLNDLKREKFHEFDSPEEWFPLWRWDKTTDFGNDDSLLKIIPSNVHTLADQYSRLLFELFERLRENYEYIKINFKQKQN